MIKKYLTIIMILSITIPSYSAVSVSDGSAFMTKNEFFSLTNNLSNRISSVENTLDTKIDSLVSSYLSRNGIWSGDVQTLISSPQNSRSDFCVAMGYQGGDKYSGSEYYYNNFVGQQTGKYRQVATNVKKIVAYGGDTYYKVINKFTKSGLLCINFRERFCSGPPQISGTWRTGDSQGRTATDSKDWRQQISLPFGFEFYEYENDCVISSSGAIIAGTRVGDAKYSWTRNENNLTLQVADQSCKIAPRDAYGSWYAFVSKGNCLVCHSVGYANGTTLGTYYGMHETNTTYSLVQATGFSAVYFVLKASIY